MAKVSRVHSLTRGQRLKLNIDSLAPGGEGVGRADGIPVFVNNTAIGDVIEAELYDVRKNFAKGKVVRIEVASPTRTTPECALAERCGGCQFQHIEYGAQLEAKREIVEQAIKHVGRLNDVVVEPALGTEMPLRYRNKVQFPVGRGKDGGIIVGYFEKSSHELVDIETCPVESQLVDRILVASKRFLSKHKISIYNEATHRGLLRHICARQSFYNNEILVTFVLNISESDFDASANQPLRDSLCAVAKQLMDEVGEVVGFCVNFNSQKGNKILGEETVCIKGTPVIEEVLLARRENMPERLKHGIKFRLSPNSFFQVNTEQAARLLEQVYMEAASIKEKLPPSSSFNIIDVYCGVGTISFWLAGLADRLIAVENNPAAVANGRENLELNDISNVEFYEGTAEAAFAKFVEQGLRPDLVVLDPPRKGASKDVLESLLKLAPTHIIYVSCNPATLARDLRILQDGVSSTQEGKVRQIGYMTHRVKPVDLFPQTYHIESVATLEKFEQPKGRKQDGTLGNLEKI